MAAAVHGGVGQRATAVDRKVVFKSVLDNPFKIPWPHIPLNIQNSALAALVSVISGVAEYHIARQTASRKRKRARRESARKAKADARKKRKIDKNTDAKDDSVEGGEAGSPAGATTAASAVAPGPDVETARMDVDENENEDTQLPPPPDVFSHITFGINEVTKRLEAQSHSLRLRTSVQSSSTTPAPDPDLPPLTFVFVCRADIDPPILIAHLPQLVAACNVPSPAKPPAPVYLIPLPKHAEHTIAETVGLRRVSVLALDSTTPSLATLASLLSSAQPPSAPWLTTSNISHVPTHIKQLRTTAPRDMRAAKRQRAGGRQAAREKKKEKGIKRHDGKNTVSKGKVRKEPKRVKITASGSAT